MGLQNIEIEGCRIWYELIGDGPLLALTPGGRAEMDAVRPLGEQLAGRCRVLLWDRRNAGRSDVFVEGGRAESEVWADDLATLLDHVALGPAYLAGGSAGCRVSLLTAIRHPRSARGLILWSASGGPYGCQYLGFNYHVPYIIAAQAGGMQAVLKTPFFAERVAANPANRERLLALDPQAFVSTMKQWNEHFHYRPDTPVVGAAEAELRAIQVPAVVFEGCDDIHPPEAAEAIHALILGSDLAPSPWGREEWMDRFTGKTAGSVFDLYPRLAPQILAFVDRVEAGK